MSEFDIDLVLKELSGERKLFHSEADFQFALAWKIQQKYTDAKVRLEYCMNLNKQAMHIDMVVFLGEKIIPIELKYKTIRCDEINIDGETYILKNHGAQDMGRYDFVKDCQCHKWIRNYSSNKITSKYQSSDASTRPIWAFFLSFNGLSISL